MEWVERTYEVGEGDTAAALGSGDVPVLGTPRLVAWLEAATVLAAREAGLLREGATSVGTRVELEHVRASAVGALVQVRARVSAVDGRAVRFEVEALRQGEPIAYGTVGRVIVDRDRFLARR